MSVRFGNVTDSLPLRAAEKRQSAGVTGFLDLIRQLRLSRRRLKKPGDPALSGTENLGIRAPFSAISEAEPVGAAILFLSKVRLSLTPRLLSGEGSTIIVRVLSALSVSSFPRFFGRCCCEHFAIG